MYYKTFLAPEKDKASSKLDVDEVDEVKVRYT